MRNQPEVKSVEISVINQKQARKSSYAVVSDRQPQSLLGLDDLDLFRAALSVREDEVVKSDLSAEQFRHVNFVRVERAEKYLKKM